jgi:hypothetical protein
MKKILFSFLLLAGVVLAGTFSSKAESYTIDDSAVETLLTGAVENPFSIEAINSTIPVSPMAAETATLRGGKNAWVAFALAFAVGGLGIHRFYLGTKPFTGIGYILTCGGIFGIVPFVDWIVLLIGAIEKDIRDYEDNPKFFMWGGR